MIEATCFFKWVAFFMDPRIKSEDDKYFKFKNDNKLCYVCSPTLLASLCAKGAMFGAKQRIVGAAMLRSNGAKAEPRKARPEEALLRRGTPTLLHINF